MALVEVERRDDHIAVVTLNDPDRRNAMGVEMGHAVHDTFVSLSEDRGLRCALLTGTPPAFSAGGDLAMLESHARRARDEGFDATQPMRAFYGLFLAVRDLPVPVIAAVNGHAIGAGLCIAIACDLVVVANEARVGLNFARLGLHPGMAASWTLPRIVGRQRAADLLYTGRLIGGVEAAEHGLALEAHPAAEVVARSLEIAAEIAASAPLVVRQLKANLRATWDRTIEDQLAAEAAAQAADYRGEDIVEGLAAVREKRSPRFSGG